MSTLLGRQPALGVLPRSIPMDPVNDFEDFYRRDRDLLAAALGSALGDTQLGAEAVDEAMARAYQRWAEALPEPQRQLVVLKYLLGWSQDEIAQSLDLRPGTVKSRLSRALAQLRVELADPQPEEPR